MHSDPIPEACFSFCFFFTFAWPNIHHHPTSNWPRRRGTRMKASVLANLHLFSSKQQKALQSVSWLRRENGSRLTHGRELPRMWSIGMLRNSPELLYCFWHPHFSKELWEGLKYDHPGMDKRWVWNVWRLSSMGVILPHSFLFSIWNDTKMSFSSATFKNCHILRTYEHIWTSSNNSWCYRTCPLRHSIIHLCDLPSAFCRWGVVPFQYAARRFDLQLDGLISRRFFWMETLQCFFFNNSPRNVPMTDPYVCHIWWHGHHQYTPVMLVYIPYMDPMGCKVVYEAIVTGDITIYSWEFMEIPINQRVGRRAFLIWRGAKQFITYEFVLDDFIGNQLTCFFCLILVADLYSMNNGQWYVGNTCIFPSVGCLCIHLTLLN